MQITLKPTPSQTYAPPQYYPPPFPGFPYEFKTIKGLKYLNWGLWVNAAASLLVILALLLFYGERGVGLSMLVFVGGAGLLGLLFFIFWILGLAFMYTGKQEYGPAHSHKVYMALIFFIVGIIISFSGGVVAIANLFSTGSITEDFESRIRMTYIIEIIFGFVSNIFLALMWVYLIFELSTQRIKNYLWIYFGLSMAIYTVASIFLIVWMVWNGYTLDFIGGVGVIGSLVLIYCYWKTYNRILKGEIKPVPPPMMPPPYFPPGQPPYQPSRSPPSYPPSS